MPIPTANYLLHANWQLPQTEELSTEQSSWLLETDSLTARLKSRCHLFRLQLLSEQQLALPSLLHKELSCTGTAILREVMLLCDEQPMIYAQSWLPASTLAAIEPLAQLGEQPLGEFIFRHPAITRGPIQLAKLDSRQLALGVACPEARIWARRSVFRLAEYPLQVVEAFLPGIYRL
ncbi:MULTISPECIES: chorismate--pyruvate lyase family protein [Alkalimonas]|uniref:Probable chorismate pyruvate-lyase n=1 Tax=Alkalimonas mucilaginosa TaxID=3057676 RepID=A0ABU7JC95_9GAMM|nr:chorismate lyase [Alkalimonas sp. MEB004]MEE2023280.1 chorismate lyase [Alkalimonas sp. MEB004]